MEKKKEETEQIAESFEAQVESIKQKGKDLKGENRDFFQSIVQRLENNNQVLDDLRKEHAAARAQLKDLKKEKESQRNNKDLDQEIKQLNHKVNLLKKQIDGLRHNKQAAIDRQGELQVLLKTFAAEDAGKDDTQERIRQLKNKLDNANIKNQETNHLFKAYNQIVYLLERQKMHWTPIIEEKQKEIKQKERDIKELELITRDSQHSMLSANNEYTRLRNANADAAMKRKEKLKEKTEQLQTTMHRPLSDAEDSSSQAKPSQSINSQPSILRNRVNRQQRDKKDEKLRAVASQYDEIREYFGKTEPEEILEFFNERRNTTDTLNKQIEELKEICSKLEKKVAQMRSALDEEEYTSAKGVGGNRIYAEGKRIHNEKMNQLKEAKAVEKSSAKHRKDVISGINHLADAMALVQVTQEDVDAQSDPISLLKWIHSKIEHIKGILNDEDGDILSETNPVALQAYAARVDSQFDIQQVDSSKRVAKRQMDPLKRAPKDNKGEITLRVKDRNAIKALAMKEAQEAQLKLKAKQKN